MYLILKLSKLCNLRCVYCYEYDELGDRARMSLGGLDHLFESAARSLADRAHEPAEVVLHGGEPSLLPASYLRSVVGQARAHFDEYGVPASFSLQTNLVRANDAFLELIEELDISLGVSIDVFGGQRLGAGGRDSQEHVLRNLQRLFDSGAVARRRVGAISVLHAENAAYATATFDFYNELGLSYRVLPLFNVFEPPQRVDHLLMSHSEIVTRLCQVAARMLQPGSRIRVFPLWNYLTAAVNHLAGISERVYEPGRDEWALIVNTNGDAYTHGDAYTSDGLLGNVFTTSVAEVLASQEAACTVAIRRARSATCDLCPYGNACTRVPLIEALPSERNYDEQGWLECPVARPVIDFLVEHVRASPGAASEVERVRARIAVPRSGCDAQAL